MNSNNDCDAVVVGAGVSGLLVACKLAEAGCKVLLLNAGDQHKPREEYVKVFSEVPQKERIISRPYQTEDGKKFAHSADGADLTLNKDFPFGPGKYYDQPGPKAYKSQSVRLAGGTTWAWRGNCPRFVPHDFTLKTDHPSLAEPERHPGVVNWPFTYDVLEPWYYEAEKALGVAGDEKEWDAITPRNGKPFPMKKIAQAYGELQLIKALNHAAEDAREFDGVKIKVIGLPQARNSEEGYNGRTSCKGNNNCIPLCPTGAKYDGSIHLNKAERLGVQVVHRAVVTRLEAAENGNISNVWYKAWDKEEKSVRGRMVILAAHSIETAKILLLSDGISNTAKKNGIVGAYLMDHLGGEGAALMPFRVFPFRGPQSTSCIESFRNHKYRGEKCAFRLTIGNDGWGRTKHPYDTLNDLLDRKLFGEELRNELFNTVTRQLRIAYATEQLPDKNNRVELTDEVDDLGIRKPRLRFAVDNYSLRGMEYAQAVIKHVFRVVGAPERDWEFTDLQAGAYSGSGHIMGTCRMGEDPNQAVVNAACRSHDHRNLYIVDSSVFPSSGTTNPTVTTAALALRAADGMLKAVRE